MKPDTIERLRPRPAHPDEAWSTATLRSITEDTPATSRAQRMAGPPRVARWVAGAVAACVLAVMTAGGVAVLVQARSASTTDAQPAGDPTSTAVGTDAGPLSTAQQADLVRTCHDDPDLARAPRVHYARSITTGGTSTPAGVAVISDAGGEYRVCHLPNGFASDHSSIATYGKGLLGPGGRLTPTADRPLEQIVGSLQSSVRLGDQIQDVQLLIGYATAEGIDRVRVQVSAGDTRSQWFEGQTAGGFVLVPVAMPDLAAPGGSKPDLALRAEAFDRTGQRVAVAQEDDLDGSSHGRGFW